MTPFLHKPEWQKEGKDPDYRFTLANERTFLAWIRTALAMLAGGILLDQLAYDIGPRFVVTATACAICALAAAMCGWSYVRWRGNEIAMRNDQPLPHTPIQMLLAVLTSVIGVVVLFLTLRQ
jgi:putative membrane protein